MISWRADWAGTSPKSRLRLGPYNKNAKKKNELGQYPTIITSRLVNNAYLSHKNNLDGLFFRRLGLINSSFFSETLAGGFAPNRVRTHRVRTQLQSTLTAFTPKYAYYLEYFSFFKREKNYLEYFSFFKHEKSVTTLEIDGGELGGCELGWERNLHHYLSLLLKLCIVLDCERSLFSFTFD